MMKISDEKLANIMENLEKTWQRITVSTSSSSRGSDYELDDSYCTQDVVRPLVATNCSEYAVAHANCLLRPARRFAEVFLLPHILETMRNLGLNRLLRLQSYTWPHLAGGSGHGAMIVGAPGSGRTLAYVPSVCHAVSSTLMECTCQRKDVKHECWQTDQYGPLALILVPDLRRVHQVSALCQAMLRKAQKKNWLTLTLNISSTKGTQFFLKLLNGVGCLVATPAQLVWFWQEAPGLMRFPCLQFLVYDDVDLMSKEQLQNAQQVLQEILPLSHSPQVVMVSKSYCPTLMSKLRAVTDKPAIVFGDILEAAVYGGARIRISIIQSVAKVNAVVQMLQQWSPKEYRTVIFCSDDCDMQCLVAALEDRNYSCLPYYQTSDLVVREQVNNWRERSHGVILLCTDNCPELDIRDAHTLIHHSMSQSWSKFKLRHLKISDNLCNIVDSTANIVKMPLNSLVLLDNNNHRQLPRLVDFLQLHQKVDYYLVEVAKRVRQELSEARNDQHALCDQILLLGKCYDPVCESRHYQSHLDRRPDYLPASGDVKVQLVKVYSPTHFCVRLLEHLPIIGTWQMMEYSAVQEFGMQLMQSKEPRRYWPPVVGTICMYHTTLTKERVRVLKVATIKNPNIVQSDLTVELQALDVDTRIFSTNCGKLFECPETLQQKAPLACDLRLYGCVPYSGEHSWSEEDCRNVKYILTQFPKDYFLQTKIHFVAAGTLFVQDLVAMVYADQFKAHVRHLSLLRCLVETNLAKKCEHAAKRIREFFVEVLLNIKKDKNVQEKTNGKPNKEIKDAMTDQPGKLHSQPGLSGRCLKLANIAHESGKENELLQELQERRSKTPKAPHQSNESDRPQHNEDEFAQLHECIMKCAYLQIEDGGKPCKNSDHVVSDAVEFLNIVMNGALTNNRKPNTANDATPLTLISPDHTHEKIPLFLLPTNVVRPTVTYYQTMTTLELQVFLPEDDQEYQVQLLKAQLLFRAIFKSSDIILQFIMTLRFPYSTMSHHISGRTVYISVTKVLALIDPLAFGQYRFLKPNHDMFDKVDHHRLETQNRLVSFLEGMDYVKHSFEAQGDVSEDEERNMEGIERPDCHKIWDS
ncbi:putative ATP-dependent RNA helicase BoYb [Drosophila santomea]|uniref:putative ATP-dependent RNA helicase BoYb n=1 Tax=Drosophila santomea TaxID=129105 RepID=UPI001952BB34|nr:putative ATP-dependent RNA helicase BoYb [Drosophila santomea]